MRRLFRGSAGQTVLETAFVLPIVIMFTFGILEICFFTCSYIGATYACRAAVRYAVTHGSASASPCTAAALQSQVQPFVRGIPQSSVTITPTWSPDNNPGGTVTVTITYSYTLKVPFDKTRTLNAVATASGVIVE